MKLIAVLMICAGCAWGQKQLITISADGRSMHVQEDAKDKVEKGWYGPVPARIKCSLYQHIEYWPECGGRYTCSTGSPEHVITHSRCVDDTRSVTEREWRALLAEVKALQSSICVGKNTDILFKCKH